jgi:hypothetical protein
MWRTFKIEILLALSIMVKEDGEIWRCGSIVPKAGRQQRMGDPASLGSYMSMVDRSSSQDFEFVLYASDFVFSPLGFACAWINERGEPPQCPCGLSVY